MITQENILEALKKIIDPDFNKSIVDLGFVQNIQIEGTQVSFDIALTTPACPVKDEFKRKAEEIIKVLEGVEVVKVNMTTLQNQNKGLYDNVETPLSKVRSIIAISSCKGGVGKSTLAAHIAQEIARRGFKVGLVDTDIHGPSIPTLFDLKDTPVYTNDKKQLLPVEKNGLKIMSFGLLLGDAPAVLRGPIVSRYVQQVLHSTDWGELDYLFIDMPPGTGDVQLTITQSAHLSGAVIITTPQTLSLLDVSRGIMMFEKVNVPILGVVENMAYFLCDQCDKKHAIFGLNAGESLKKRFGIEVLSEIPLLPQMTEKIEKPLVNSYITETVDNVIKALGKISIQQKQVPKFQFNDKEVTLTWPDGQQVTVNNRTLRLSCRCALCVNESTGENLLKEEDIKDTIAAKEITPLGNYAVGISWNDGHTSGIYPYDTIKQLNKPVAKT